MEIVTRAEAREKGLDRYFTGKPCIHGHVCERRVSGNCVMCSADFSASTRKKEYDKAYNAENKKRIRKRSLEYMNKTWEERYSYLQKWQAENKEKVRAAKHNYKRRRASQVSGGPTSAELAAWISAQKMNCYWCGACCNDSYHIDHYYPLSKGGEHALENMVIACPSCNVRKNARDPHEFAQSVAGRLF